MCDGVGSWCCASPAVQTFKLDGRLMIDPLSLADFPSIASSRTARIHVEVAGSADGRGESKRGDDDSGGKEAEDDGGKEAEDGGGKEPSA